MKKIIILLSLLLCFSMSGFAQGASSIGLKKKNPPIVPPRTLLPISAYQTAGGVDLQFAEDLGMAVVTVVNQTTGEQWLDYVDTAAGYAHIDTTTSEPAGAYLIYIELEDGSTYWGEFLRE